MKGADIKAGRVDRPLARHCPNLVFDVNFDRGVCDMRGDVEGTHAVPGAAHIVEHPDGR